MGEAAVGLGRGSAGRPRRALMTGQIGDPAF